MRIVLFAGQSKTGTSTLQRHLAGAAGALQAQGVLYPHAGRVERGAAHHRLATPFLAPDLSPSWAPPIDPAAWRTQVGRELADSGARTLVLASELFFHADAGALVAALPAGEVHVVVALRRQDLHLDASVQQQMKTLAFREFDDARLRRRREAGRFDYDATLRRWEGAVGCGAVSVLPFEAPLLAGGLVHRMLSLAGLRPWPGMVEPAPENVRLGRDAVALLQRLHFDLGVPRPQAMSLRPALEAWSRDHPDPPAWRHVLPPAIRRQVLEEAGPGNAAVHARHPWPGRDALFMDREVDEAFEPYPGLAADTAAGLRQALLPGVTDPSLRTALAAACGSA